MAVFNGCNVCTCGLYYFLGNWLMIRLFDNLFYKNL